jgi:hypothetical protein
LDDLYEQVRADFGYPLRQPSRPAVKHSGDLR